jgi:amino acid adenylation domain-containing protein
MLKIEASYHQERLWFIDRFESGVLYDSSPIYHNIPLILEINGSLRVDLLEQSIRRVIQRHGALRTQMDAEDNKPLQVIHQEVNLVLPLLELGIDSKFDSIMTSVLEEARRPFVLDKDPLIRGLLLRSPNEKFLLVLTLHHIIADKYSLGILVREVFSFYNHYLEDKIPQLPDLPIHYADFSQWQKRFPEKTLKSLLVYWKRKLDGELQVLEIPTDHPRAAVHTFKDASRSFTIPQETYDKIKEFCEKEKTSPFVLLLTVFKVLLHWYSGHDEIIVGTNSANRNQPGTEGIIGPIANLLALRTHLSGSSSFDQLLRDLDRTVKDAYKYQALPFDKLVLELNPRIDMSRTALFDVLFQYEDAPMQIPAVAGLKIKHLETNIGWGKYDLNILIQHQPYEEKGCLTGILVYNIDYYNDSTIARLVNHYKILLEHILKEPGCEVSTYNFLTEAEKRKLLVDWNDTCTNYPREAALHQLFETQVEDTPERIAVVYRDKSLTYRELNSQANQAAVYLRNKYNIRPNDLVCLLLEPSEHMIITILGVLKSGGAYVPIDLTYPEKRINYILDNSESKFIITAEDHSGKVYMDYTGTVIAISSMLNRETDMDKGYENPGNENKPEDTAYVIYTSGTTGHPKGCLISHRNMVRLFKNDKHPFDFTSDDIWVIAHSYCFDFSVWEMYGSLLNGGRLIVPDRDIVRDTGGFLSMLKHHQVTVLNQTPAAFYQLIKEEKGSLQKGLDNHLRCVVFGGDKLEPAYLKEWIDIYSLENIALINMYGITETTVHVTYYSLTEEDIRSNGQISPIGVPLPETKLYIFNGRLHLVPIGVRGEIFVGGSGVSQQGYLHNPKLTGERFIENPYKKGELLYRSGDLGKWLPDGRVDFCGRVDHQVKIRGFRIEPGEIENRLLNHAEIRDAVVIARIDESGDKNLCGYVVVERPGAFESPQVMARELREYLQQTLPDYMVPLFFVLLDKIPLTFNGKLDREALPAPEAFSLAAQYTAPRDAIEKKLAEIWSDVLKIERIGIDDNFFELGGHSLKATTLVSRIHKIFDLKVPLADFFKQPTVRELAEFIKSEAELGERETFVSIEAAEKREYYGLSSAQKRLYILQQMDERGSEAEAKGTSYNMPEVVKLEGVIDRDRFQETFKKMIWRHESLRTGFLMIHNQPGQRIYDAVEFDIEYYSATEGTEEQPTISNFIRPFDLSRAPLLRVGLINVEKEEHILMVDMHHIISDGTSIRVLTKEFMALYGGEDVESLRIQYKDFSQWQNSAEIRETVKKQEGYWLNELAGEIPVLNIPIDYPRPAIQSFTGTSVGIEIGDDETKALRSLALKEEVTLFMLILALYNVLLCKLSGQEDIVVGTPIAGRRHADLQHVIGMFVNTLVMRNYPTGEKPFNTFLKEVKERTLAAFENQEYQFEDLVEKVAVNRDASRNPLFDAMFALQNLERAEVEIPGLKLKPYEFENEISKFDITFQVNELAQRLLIFTEYSTALFREETLRGFLDRLLILIEIVCSNPGIRISKIDILTEEEKHQLLYDFNDTTTPYPGDKTIHELYKEQVEKTPDRTAVISVVQSVGVRGTVPLPMHHITITYKELNHKSNQLANHLRAWGVGPDTVAGIMGDKSIEMIIGILAILKAGGAYLPIEPDYPQERIRYMLADSNAKILVSELSELSKVSKGIEVIGVNSAVGNRLARTTVENHLQWSPAPAISLAYVIYTSGTTGRPKGVMVDHKNVVRLVKKSNYLELDEDHRILQTGALAFDASTFEIWGTLLNGSILYLVEKEKIINPNELGEVVETFAINTMWMTSSLFNQMLDENIKIFTGLKNLLVGGEALSCIHINKLRQKFPLLNVINGYGPTENTTFSTTYVIDRDYKESIPIGRPIANSTAYIVDKWNKLQPVGVPGELYVGGDGIARGYLNDPELTAEKFDQDFWDYQDYQDEKNYKKFCGGPGGGFSKEPPGHRGFYKTGDLVRWLPDGNIEFIGRIDHQVKIRGFRIELGEIESQMSAHNEIKDVVVLPKKDLQGNHRYLCAYFVSDSELSITRLREFLSKSFPDYMIPSYFIQLDRIPLTPNGKVDRRALPETELAADREYIAPRDELEKQMVRIWSEVLNVSQMGIDDDFFELGGHSLKATILISRIHKVFNIRVPLADFFRKPRIREFAELIKGAAGDNDKYAAIKPVEKKEYYPLSSSQKRLYIMQQTDLQSTGYNMPSIMWLEGIVEKARLEKAFGRLIQRHESLRTSFAIQEGDPVQRVHNKVEFEIEHFSGERSAESQEFKAENLTLYDQNSKRYADIIHSFVRPFNLSFAPLLRIGLIKTEEQKHIMMVDMHHIITDGTSNGIAIREFMALYADAVEEFSCLPIQYKDFSEWKNSESERVSMRKQEAYWLKEFEAEPPLLNLITDYPRSLVQNFEGCTASFELTDENSCTLKELAKEENVTIYMVLLAIYNVLLSKLSTQEDIIVGTPVAGRSHADLQPLIGMFVNTLALRNYPAGEKTFREFLKEIKKRTLEAFENQDYPFENLAEIVAADRDPGRNPLFDTMFSLQNLDLPGLEIPGLQLKPYKFETRISKFDLCLYGIEVDDKLKFTFEYKTSLFKDETIDEFIRYFKDIAAVVVEDRDIKLNNIDLSINVTDSESDSDIFQELYEDFDF